MKSTMKSMGPTTSISDDSDESDEELFSRVLNSMISTQNSSGNCLYYNPISFY